MSDHSTSVLCVGGPKDGQRLMLSAETHKQGRFEVAAGGDVKMGRFESVTYLVNGYKQGEKTHWIAEPVGQTDSLQRLIDNYRPNVEKQGLKATYVGHGMAKTLREAPR